MWIYEPTKVFCSTLDFLALFINVSGRTIFRAFGCSAAFLQWQLKSSVIIRKMVKDMNIYLKYYFFVKTNPVFIMRFKEHIFSH
jgi:hypothetical protein